MHKLFRRIHWFSEVKMSNLQACRALLIQKATNLNNAPKFLMYLSSPCRHASTSSSSRQHYVSPLEMTIDFPKVQQKLIIEENVAEKLDFTDHRQAFKHMTLWELSRSLIVLSVCSYQTFSANSLKVSLRFILIFFLIILVLLKN